MGLWKNNSDNDGQPANPCAKGHDEVGENGFTLRVDNNGIQQLARDFTCRNCGNVRTEITTP